MDKDLYTDAIEYEKLTQAVYQSILHEEGCDTIDVKHNVDIEGRSGVKHQIDIHWKFRQAGLEHVVLIECKNYSTALTLEKVRNFYGVLSDIGNCRGRIVTRVGFQSGAAKYAEFYGIDLKLLNPPTEDDWKGKIRNIHINIKAKTVISEPDKPLQIKMNLSPETDEQKMAIQHLIDSRIISIPNGPLVKLLDKNRMPITEEFREWIPKQLDVLKKEPGGPYHHKIEVNDAYIVINQETEDEQLVKLGSLEVSYFVGLLETREILIHGDEIVKGILKDFHSGAEEYVYRKK